MANKGARERHSGDVVNERRGTLQSGSETGRERRDAVRRRGREGGTTERPLLVGLLPATLALLALLVAVLSARIWILNGMLDAKQRSARRAQALATSKVPAPAAYVSPRSRPTPPAPPPGEVRATERRTWVVINAVPANVATYIYANGGSLLGRAPVRTADLPPGTHRLLFWAPAIGGRVSRTVVVQRDATTWVNAEVRPAAHF